MDWPISWNDVKEKIENSSGGMEVIRLTDYGIDVYDLLSSGQTEFEGDYRAFVTAVSNAVAANKTPALWVHELLPAYVFPVFVQPNASVSMTFVATVGDDPFRFEMLVHTGYNYGKIYLYQTPMGD